MTMLQEPLAQPQVTTQAWTEKLVRERRRNGEPAPVPVVEDWAAQARVALWSLFSEAVTEANLALAAAGLSEQLTIVTHGQGCRVTLEGDEGGHEISVHTALRQVGGHLSGGAQISSSATRATISLAAVLTAAGPRWVVPASGCEFTAAEVGDLLLSVFGDDGAATSRLLPCFSLGDGF